MARHLLCLLVMTVVQVDCFRVPLPYGTGYHNTNQDDELSNQGIFHRLWHSFNCESSKEPKVEGNKHALQVSDRDYFFFY